MRRVSGKHWQRAVKLNLGSAQRMGIAGEELQTAILEVLADAE